MWLHDKSRGSIFQHNKDYAQQTTSNIIPNGKKRQEYLISSFSLNIVLESLARTVRQEEEIKGIQIGKAAEVFLFA